MSVAVAATVSLTVPSANAAPMEMSKAEQKFLREFRETAPQLAWSNAKVLSTGRWVCARYAAAGDLPATRNAITSRLRTLGLRGYRPFSVNLSAKVTLCPRAGVTTWTESPGTSMLVLPADAGWGVNQWAGETGTLKGYVYLSTRVPAGSMMPLGNAASLCGVSVGSYAASGAWYQSAFATISILDAQGTVLATESDGYSPTTGSPINNAGLGSVKISLNDYPTAAFVRLDRAGSDPGPLSLIVPNQRTPSGWIPPSRCPS